MNMRLSKKMKQALKDLPIIQTISEHSVIEGESMSWIGKSGEEYRCNTLCALVRRNVVQYRLDRGYATFEKKTNESHPLFKKWNEIWID